MAYMPDYVVNKTAVNIQRFFVIVGVFTGVIAFGAFSNGEPMAGVVSALIAAAVFWVASKIKTKKRLVGGNGVYK